MRRSTLATQLLAATGAAFALLTATAAVRAEKKPEPGVASFATMAVSARVAPTERLLDGMVEAVNQSTVSAQSAGRVAAIYYDVNDKV